MMYDHEKSDPAIVCAGQRMNHGGSSPLGARMRGAVSKSGGNASLAVERKEGMEKSKRARRRKPETAKTNRKPSFSWFLGGQGVRSNPESEGFEQKDRAVINGATPKIPEDEQDGQRRGK